MKGQSLIKGLYSVERIHSGAVLEELQPVGRAHDGEACEGLYPMGETNPTLVQRNSERRSSKD